MTWQERLKALFGRARSEAGELAETAVLKVELKGMLRRRDAILRAIGGRAYEMSRKGAALPGFETEFADVRRLDELIAEKKSAMERRGEAAPAESAAAR